MDAIQVQSTSTPAYNLSIPSGSTGPDVVVLVRTIQVGSTKTEPEEDMSQLNDILQRLGNVENKVGTIGNDLATITERVSHLPTKTAVYSIAGTFLVGALGALWWVVQQFLAPLLSLMQV